MLKKFSILFFIGLIAQNPCSSQNVYLDSTYNLFNGTEYARAIFRDSIGYSIFGVTKPDTNGFRPCMMKIDDEGNKLYEKTIPVSGFDHGSNLSNTNFIKSLDGGFVYAGTALHQEEIDSSWVAIVKFDSNGDTVFIKRFSNPDKNWRVNSIVQNDDGSYLLAGKQDLSQENSKMLLLKIDQQGNFIWSQTYGNSTDIRNIKTITKANNGFILGGYRTIGSAYYGLLTKVDLLGNILWQQTLPDMSLIWNLNKLSDGNYVAVGRHIHIHYPGNSSWGNCLALKFSENGNIIWSNNYGRIEEVGSFLNFLELNNGNLLFTGSQGEEEGFLNDAFILKTLPDGDSIGAVINNKCGLNSTENYVDVLEKGDGNLIAVGSFWMGCTPDFWVVGLDSLGCHEQGCESLSIDESPESETDNIFSIYPNPSENIFKISTSINNFSLKIYSTTGMVIHEDLESPSQIDLSGYDSGLYILEFINNGKMKRKRIIKN